jgi:hypothetical protein
MAKRLTPEERAQRDLDRKAAAVAAKAAAHASRQTAWAAQKQASRDAFTASLTEHQAKALSVILAPMRQEQDPYKPAGTMRDVYDGDFIESLANQLRSCGYLSPNQVACVERQYVKKLEIEEKLQIWPDIDEGHHVDFLGKVTSIEKRQHRDVPPFIKIKLTAHYGREFQINTNSKKIIDRAIDAKEEGAPLAVSAKIKWMSSDKRIVVLGTVGAKITEL